MRRDQPRVLLDATAVHADLGGYGRYVDGLLSALSAAGADLAVTCQRSDAERYSRLAPQAQVVAGPVAISHRPARQAWEQTGLPLVAEQVGAGVVHAPLFTMPLRSRVPVAVTLHNAAAFGQADLLMPTRVTSLRAATRTALRRAARCIVPSEATRQALVAATAVDPERDPARVDVVPYGVDPALFHPPTQADVDRVRARLGLRTGSWVAFLGELDPLHGAAVLVQAWATAVQGLPDPPALVLAGGGGAGDDVDRALAAVPPGLRLLRPGHLRTGDLPGYLGGAEVSVHPSRGEGLGLTVLEAMACGAAVLTSAQAAVGEPVATVDTSVEELTAALGALLADQPRRAALSAAAAASAADRTWAATAERHLEVYRRAAAQ